MESRENITKTYDNFVCNSVLGRDVAADFSYEAFVRHFEMGIVKSEADWVSSGVTKL